MLTFRRTVVALIAIALLAAACGSAPRPATNSGPGIAGLAGTPTLAPATPPGVSPTPSSVVSPGPSTSPAPGSGIGWPTPTTNMLKYCETLLPSVNIQEQLDATRFFSFTADTGTTTEASYCAWSSSLKSPLSAVTVSIGFLTAYRDTDFNSMLSILGVSSGRISVTIPGATQAVLIPAGTNGLHGSTIIAATPLGPMLASAKASSSTTIDFRAGATEFLTAALEKISGLNRSVWATPPVPAGDLVAACALALDPATIRYYAGLNSGVVITTQPPSSELGGYLTDCRWIFNNGSTLLVGIYQGSSGAIIAALAATIPSDTNPVSAIVPGATSGVYGRLLNDHYGMASDPTTTVIIHYFAPPAPKAAPCPKPTPSPKPGTTPKPATPAPSLYPGASQPPCIPAATSASPAPSAAPGSSLVPAPSPSPDQFMSFAPGSSLAPGASPFAAPIATVQPRDAVIGLLSEVLARYKGQ